MKTACAVFCTSIAMLGVSIHAQATSSAPSDQAIHALLIDTAANISQQMMNCGQMSEKEVLQARAEQRASFPQQMGFSTEQYDAIYTKSLTSFNKQWAALSAAERQQSCAQIHMAPAASTPAGTPTPTPKNR